MTGTFYRRLGLLFVSAAGFGVWQWAPGTRVDRATFTAVARGFSNPPPWVSGKGTHAEPWQLRARPDSQNGSRQAPLVVSLGDDPTGFFQSSPPAPIDLAVIFRNFQRLGIKKAASAAVLAWQSADPIALAALEKSLAGFDSLVMAAPLSRGAVSSPILPGFRRTSLPVTAIHGDVSALPIVNRCPIPDLVLGGEKAMAGFSVLESEPAAPLLPLLARWDDRVVFSFAFLTVLQRYDLSPEGVTVRLGESISLWPNGPMVAIDRHGRLIVPLQPINSSAEISAEALIGGGDGFFSKEAPEPVILRDDQSAADATTRVFSRELASAVATIASEAGLGELRNVPRLSRIWELAILFLVIGLLAMTARASAFRQNLTCLFLAGLSMAAQWIGFGLASVWLPGLPVWVMVLAAWLCFKFMRELRDSPPATIRRTKPPLVFSSQS